MSSSVIKVSTRRLCTGICQKKVPFDVTPTTCEFCAKILLNIQLQLRRVTVVI